MVYRRDAPIAAGYRVLICIAAAGIKRKEVADIHGGAFIQLLKLRGSRKRQLLHGDEDGMTARCRSVLAACLHRQHVGDEQNVLHRG